jgi:hypothetical protein
MTGASTVSEILIREIDHTMRAYARPVLEVGSLFILAFVLICLAVVPTSARSSKQSDDIAHLVGNWTGESICANKEKFPACKDEHVVYHVTVTPNKTDTVTIKMDKIVDGKPEFMGESDFAYDSKNKTLKSEYQNSRVHLTIEFSVKGDVIEGIVASLPERTIARNIKVKKDK